MFYTVRSESMYVCMYVLLLLLLLLVNLQWTPHGRRRERPQRSWRNQVKSRNMEEDMAKDRHLWRLGVGRRLLAV